MLSTNEPEEDSPLMYLCLHTNFDIPPICNTRRSNAYSEAADRNCRPFQH